VAEDLGRGDGVAHLRGEVSVIVEKELGVLGVGESGEQQNEDRKLRFNAKAQRRKDAVQNGKQNRETRRIREMSIL